jgi:hypothetical protein
MELRCTSYFAQHKLACNQVTAKPKFWAGFAQEESRTWVIEGLPISRGCDGPTILEVGEGYLLRSSAVTAGIPSEQGRTSDLLFSQTTASAEPVRGAGPQLRAEGGEHPSQ